MIPALTNTRHLPHGESEKSTEITGLHTNQYHYTKLTVVRVSVHPESITGSDSTPVKKPAFFASLSFDITEAVDRKS